MKRSIMSHDYRVRLCGRCHSWFPSEGAHNRFCAPCRAAAKIAMELPWRSVQEDAVDHDNVAVAAGEEVDD